MREQRKIQAVPFSYSMIICNYQWKEETDDFFCGSIKGNGVNGYGDESAENNRYFIF